MHRPKNLKEHHQANQESLEVILPAQSTSYILMACESMTLRDHMRKEIEQHFSSKDHILQDYSQLNMRSLVSTLSENLPADALKGEKSDYIIHITYLENSLLIDHFEGEGELIKNLEEETNAMNSAFPFLSMIWLDTYSIDFLQEKVPAFCSNALDILSWWEEKEVEHNSPYEELEKYYAQLGDFEYAAKSTASLEIASIYEAQHSFQQAMIHYQRVLEYMQLEEGTDVPLAAAYTGMGRIMMQAQDYYQAADTFRLALDSVDSDNHTMLGDIYRYMGICRHHSNNREMALSFFRTSNEAYTQVNDQEALALNYQDMAVILHTSGEAEKAIEHLEKAKEIVQQMGDLQWEQVINQTIDEYTPPEVPPPTTTPQTPAYESDFPPVAYDDYYESFSEPTPAYKKKSPSPSKPKEDKKETRMGRRAFLERFIKRGKK